MQATDTVPRTTAILWTIGGAVAAWLAKTFLSAGVKGAIVGMIEPKLDAIGARIDRLEGERAEQHQANLREFEALRQDIDRAMGRRRLPDHGRERDDR